MLLTLLLLLLLERGLAQFAMFGTLYNETIGASDAVLEAQLQDAPDLWQIYYPNKYLAPTDYYTFLPPARTTEYTQNVIFDPCNGYEFNCCFDTYGTPEFVRVDSDPTSPTYGSSQQVFDDGTILDPTVSRLPDDSYYIDNSCTGPGLPYPRTDCVLSRIAASPFPILPRCWNRNDTLVANRNCRSPLDGSVLPLCIEVAVTQTSFIVECGGEFVDDEHCGTFLEIHRPGYADKISEVRLRGMYPSGYRMTVISTTYKANAAQTICYDQIKKGLFEIWWVQRTRYNFIVERRVPFQIISPECDWDDPNNRYLPYATLFLPDGSPRATVLAGLNPFDPNKLVFTRQRVEGTAALPGKGMGSTLVEIEGDTYPPTTTFDQALWHNVYTYEYTPAAPDYTVTSGVIAPTQAEQTALAALTLKRGYRRLEDVPEEQRLAMLAEVRMRDAAREGKDTRQLLRERDQERAASGLAPGLAPTDDEEDELASRLRGLGQGSEPSGPGRLGGRNAAPRSALDPLRRLRR